MALDLHRQERGHRGRTAEVRSGGRRCCGRSCFLFSCRLGHFCGNAIVAGSNSGTFDSGIKFQIHVAFRRYTSLFWSERNERGFKVGIAPSHRRYGSGLWFSNNQRRWPCRSRLLTSPQRPNTACTSVTPRLGRRNPWRRRRRSRFGNSGQRCMRTRCTRRGESRGGGTRGSGGNAAFPGAPCRNRHKSTLGAWHGHPLGLARTGSLR